MYNNNLVVAIKKSNGDTLRESSYSEVPSDRFHPIKQATVYLPFDSEYQLFIKNNASTRAVVSVTIDGTDVLGGYQLVVEPYVEYNLERFILDGNLSKGRKFKFVSLKNEAVQNPQEPKNGLVEIKCRWEVVPIPMPTVYIPNVWTYPYKKYTRHDDTGEALHQTFYTTFATSCRSGGEKISNMSMQNCSANYLSTMDANVVEQAATEQKGATVEGGESQQQFHTISVGALQYGETIIQFQILAPKDERQPITVKATRDKYCTSCGTKLPKDAKYCMTCGIAQPALI